MKAFSVIAIAVLALAAMPVEARHGRTVTLQVDDRVAHLPLKRLLRQQTGIDPDRFVLRGVTIHRSKRDARRNRHAAVLGFGRHAYDYIPLHGRHTYVSAPRDLRGWRMHLTPRTRVRDVTLHLKRKHRPRHRWERRNHRRAYDRHYRAWRSR